MLLEVVFRFSFDPSSISPNDGWIGADEMEAVAASVPVLAGRAAERAQSALEQRKPSDKHEAAALRLEWAALLADDETVGARS